MTNGSRASTDIRRKQIVRAALKIIATKGVRGLTTASIAAEVGISEASIYRHFRGKDEILSVTVEAIGEDLRSNLEDALKAGSPDAPIERLKRTFMLHLDYIERNGGVPRLIFSDEVHSGDGYLKQKLLQAISSYAANLEAIVRDGQKTGSIRNSISAKAAAMILIGMIQATTLRWSLSGYSFPLVAEGMNLWDDYERFLRSSA